MQDIRDMRPERCEPAILLAVRLTSFKITALSWSIASRLSPRPADPSTIMA